MNFFRSLGTLSSPSSPRKVPAYKPAQALPRLRRGAFGDVPKSRRFQGGSIFAPWGRAARKVTEIDIVPFPGESNP